MPCTRCPLGPDAVHPCIGESEPDLCRLADSANDAGMIASLSADLAARPRPAGDRVPTIQRDRPGDRRVRVGFWAPGMGVGGAEAWMVALAGACDPTQIRWSGCSVTGGEAGVDPGMAAALGAQMPLSYGLDSARRLAEISDVILSWSVLNITTRLAGLPSTPPVVQACHFPPESGPWSDTVRQWLAPAARFVAVSEVALGSIPRRFAGRSSVIWNAVDPQRLVVRRDPETMRNLWGVPAGAKVVGYLGRMSPEKDPAAMLRLAASLPDGWVAVAVGGGAELAGLRAAGEPRLILPGTDLAAGDVLGAFDCLVNPSRYESFGLTIAEGLWSGVPTLATTAGLPKIVPGLVREIPIGADGPELAAALATDIADALGTRERVDRAARFARDRLAPDRFGRDWTGLLCSVARPRPIRLDPIGIAMLADQCRWASGPCGCDPNGPPRNCSRPDRPKTVRRPRCLECVRSDLARPTTPGVAR